jgi:predicted site-specific integrase-resolvase
MDKLYSISKTAKLLDVTPKTLRIWDKENKLKPILTSGGHRRYKESDIKAMMGYVVEPSEHNVICATYSRVSSQKQKSTGDLDRQSQRLSEYCAKHNLYVEYIIKDCGSGLNDKRSGFIKLTDLVINGKINKVIIEHRDRLTRFQYYFIERIYKVFGCEIIAVDDKDDVSDAEELTRDLMALLASFSGKYYGKRSLDRRKENKSNH